jgi:hypothetical protein
VVRRSALDKVWRRAVAQTVAQPDNQAIRGLHFHDLRGSHKTWLHTVSALTEFPSLSWVSLM